MPIGPGTRLGPYEIQSALGAGGMGEVYRARDTRLDRTVAVKVLPPSLAADPQLRTRFEQEARAVAALSHPNICAIHDVGHHDGTDFLVLEYLEGQTLAQRLEAGALPLGEALQIAIQLAHALDRAHRAGIIHRDLKPGNVMLTKPSVARQATPQVKLLDFGLAKASGPLAAGPGISMLTTPAGLTVQGTILGTLQYMAPEQLEGREADARSDIFAFGAVLYEMVTGTKAFHGQSQASLIGSILKDTPKPASVVSAHAPPSLDRVIAACLEKDPEERWQTIRDVLRELTWQADAGAQAAAATSATGGRQRRWLPWALVILFAALSAATVTLSLRRPGATGSPLTRLSIQLPAAVPYNALGFPGRSVAISPDGRRIVYVSSTGPGRRQLHARLLDQLTIEPLSGTDGAYQPFFSPDGRWLAFFTGSGELKKLSLDGGVPVVLVRGLLNPQWAFGAWRDDGTIVFSAFESLMQVSADGGTPAPLTTVNAAQSESFHQYPQIVPSTGDVLFTVGLNDGGHRLEILQWDTKTRSTLLEDTGGVVLTESGHMLFSRDDVLMVATFDPAARRLGPPIALPERVLVNGARFGNPQVAVSAAGTLVYVPTNPMVMEPTLGWVSRAGVFTEVGKLPQGAQQAALSPDGNLALIGALPRAYIFDLARRVTTTLNLGSRQTDSVSWHPDGKRITIGGSYLSLFDLDTGKETRLTEGGRPKRSPTWSPDGRVVAYMTFNPARDIFMLSMDPGAKPQPLVATDAVELDPAISPDGRWIAYRATSAGSSRTDVYVARFPEVTGRVQITSQGGGPPFWSRDGRELFFGAPPGVFQSVAITPGDQVRVGETRILFKTTELAVFGPARDGQSFLAIRQPPVVPVTELVVMQNWTEELKRLTTSK